MAKEDYNNQRGIIPEDEKEEKTKLNRDSLRSSATLLKYIKDYRWHFVVGLVLLALSSMVFMVMPYLAGVMVDVAQGEYEGNLTLENIGIGLIVILILQGFISYFRIYLFAFVSEKGVSNVRMDVYSKLLTLPLPFFEENKVGELVSRVTSDIDRLYNAFSYMIAEFLRQFIILITGIIFLAFTTPKLAGIMLATFPFIVGLAFIFGRYIRRFSKKRQKTLADTNSILSESMYSIKTVKSYTNESFEFNRYSRSIHSYIKVAMSFAKTRGLFAAFIVTILSGGIFFIIWMGAKMLQDGELTSGNLVAFVSYTAIIGGSIAALGNFYGELVGIVGATERIREILDMDKESHDKVIKQSSEITSTGTLEFRNVGFSYPTRPDIEVLKDISFKIRSGEKVALVGSSGAGKSTIMQLLLRFYDYQNGNILLDNEPIESFDLKNYRQQFGIVPQDVILFSGTIRENILYGRPEASEEEILEAARQSNSLEFIEKFPEGLETIVGERGVKLSGGQKQRIAIARAILKDPAILLLDEATSSLDAESEKVVQEALDVLMKGRTSIIIAHRLSTIKDVDEIYFLEGGRISEKGSHTELMERENGRYKYQANLGGLFT